MTTRTLLLLPLGLLLFSTAWAFDYRGVHWPWQAMPAPYFIHHDLAPDLPDADVVAAIQAGYQHWVDVECAGATAQFAGRSDSSTFGINDGQNTVSWRVFNWPESRSALAVTSNISDHRNLIIDADMIFNGVHYNWDTNGSRVLQDVEAVATHEAGHFFGMGHSEVREATMWPSTGAGNLVPRDLHEDDKRGICNLYPSNAVGISVVGTPCGPQGQCDDGLACVDDDGYTYCSGYCDNDGACPVGFVCREHPVLRSACMLETRPPAGGSQIGDACGPDGECEGDLYCVRDGDLRYCSGPCGHEDDCPMGFNCEDRRGGRACVLQQDEAVPDAGSGADSGEGTDAGDVDAGALPASPQPAEPTAEGGLCATSPGSSAPATPGLLVFLALGLAELRRRRR